jgi:hypothetical protein
LIDTLKLTRNLERRGIRREEAEAIAEALQGDMGARFDRVEQRLEGVEERLDNLEQRFDQRFEKIEQRFEQVDQRFGRVEEHLARLESDVRLLKWMVGATLTGILALIARTFFG